VHAITIAELEWFHDAIVESIDYLASEPTTRQLTIVLKCSNDAGTPEWDGKRVQITADDVVLMRHLVFATSNAESIDAIHESVSQEMIGMRMKLTSIGAMIPGKAFTINFHSGSSLELVCKGMLIEMLA
jgi:hypothetical protein